MIWPPDENEPAAGCHRPRVRVSMALWRAAEKILLRRLSRLKLRRARRVVSTRRVVETVIADQRGRRS